MCKMKLESTETCYHDTLEQWTSRQQQLNMLHEEIIHKREALLGTWRSVLHQTTRQETSFNNTEATVRNGRLLKDVQSLEEFLTESQQEQVSSSFAYLQANYKSMVENMFPIWQKSLKEMQK